MELSTEANTSASHNSVVMNFTTPKMFLLLKCSFGLTFGSKSIKVRALILQAITPCKKISDPDTRNYEKCSFRPEWCDKYSWLHYDV